MNLCETGLFHIVEVFLKVPVIIIIFDENYVLGPNILIYINFGGERGGGLHGPPYIFSLLFIKSEKVKEHDLYLNQILHHFDLQKNFLG